MNVSMWQFLRPAAVARLLCCHLLISRTTLANEQWEAAEPWESTEPWEASEPWEAADAPQLVRGQLLPLATAWPPWPSPPPPPLPAPSPSAPSPLHAVAEDGMRLELRFLGGHGLAPMAHTLLVELSLLLGVQPQGRIVVQETHAIRNSPLSYATFDLLPPNNVGLSAQPSATELAARLVSLVGGMQCDSMLDVTEVWSSDGCSNGRTSIKLVVDDKYDTLEGVYPPSWHACARDGSYEYEQTLRVRLRPPLPPGQPLLLRLVAPENGTAAFDNQIVPQLGSDGGGGIPRFEGELGPAAPCVATAGGTVELQDGGVSVAACSSSATTDSEWLYLTGSGRGRLGEEGAGGMALAEVQACRPDSSSRLFALTADGSFLYPTLARVDVRAGLQQYSTTGDGGHDYLCGGLGKPCVKTTRSSVMTQLMPELVARHFDAGSSEGIGLGLTAVVLALLLLVLAGACCCALTNFWRARRAWQRELERDQIERVQLHDEMYGDDDVHHRLSEKHAAPGSKTPLDSALRKVSQLAPVIY
jgi:hypothetical protein